MDGLTQLQQKNAQPPEHMSGSKLKPGTTILVVDDKEDLRSIAKNMLTQGLGATVVCAENGQVAKEKIMGRTTPFDMIFTDLEMPVMDGRELAEWLRVTEPRTPIMMWTGNYATIAPSDRPEVNVLLPKPANLDEVVTYVRALLHHCIEETTPAVEATT